jgi:TRAP-type C4-dicarboxylate transport system permease small subunit
MKLLASVSRFNKVTNAIAGTTLTCMMLFTVADTILRYFGKPILGSMELGSLASVVVIGFALPHTSWTKAHVNVDLLLASLSGRGQAVTNVATRILSIALFATAGGFLIKKALYMYKTGEVTMTLQIPFYPITYCLAACCFLQCLILLCQIIEIAGEKYE